jgi:gas vesicle protein
MKSGKVFLGIVAGVAVGAILGILFAPDKGWNTRKRISKKAEDVADDLREKFDEFLDSISVKVDEAKEQASDMSEKVKSKVNDVKKEAKTAAS